MTRPTVWDASAILFVLLQEPGWERFVGQLESGAISTVNLAEVATKLLERGGTVGETLQVLGALPVELHDFTSDLAYRAADLRAASRDLGLSLGDRACLALGMSLGATILTADRIWSRLALDVDIVLVRGASG